MAPIFGYYFNGGYYPEGGSQRLADVLVEALEENGGRITYKKGVQRILSDKDGVKGVELDDGTQINAPIVISNADLHRTVNHLLEDDALPADFLQQHGRLESSTSAFAVQLGLDYTPDASMLTFLRSEKGLELGIAIPSIVDPERAHEGCASVELLSFIPADEVGEWNRDDDGYRQKKHAYGNKMIAEAEKLFPGLTSHIVFREDATPATFERYVGVNAGAIYGPALTANRPPMKIPVPGLMLAGSGVFPGAGIEAVTISGVLAADEIIQAQTQS